eukprot:EG_transcript_17138
MACALLLLTTLCSWTSIHGELHTYVLSGSTVGFAGNGKKPDCIFLGPVSVGDAGGDAGLVVDVSATPGVAVALGVSQKRQCPPPARLTCAGASSTTTDAEGHLYYQNQCLLAADDWVILYALDSSTSAAVSGSVTLDRAPLTVDAFSFRLQPLANWVCLFFGPLAAHDQIHISMTTEDRKEVAVRVTEQKWCPPDDNIWCGPNKFPVTRQGVLDLHGACDIPEGAWVVMFMVNKDESTRVTGTIAFQRDVRGFWGGTLFIGIMVLVAILTLVCIALCLWARWRKRRLRQAALKEQQLADCTDLQRVEVARPGSPAPQGNGTLLEPQDRDSQSADPGEEVPSAADLEVHIPAHMRRSPAPTGSPRKPP